MTALISTSSDGGTSSSSSVVLSDDTTGSFCSVSPDDATASPSSSEEGADASKVISAMFCCSETISNTATGTSGVKGWSPGSSEPFDSNDEESGFD